MDSSGYAAFLSYSSEDAEWVEVFHEHLERCLAHYGAPRQRVFFAGKDIAAGQSWVRVLNQHLDETGKVLLVATPEALASSRVQDEWESLIADRPGQARREDLLEQAEDGDGLDRFAGPQRLEELLGLTPDDHDGVTGRWVVLGDPGSGKSTLLRHLAWSLATRDDPPWVPLLVQLPEILGSGQWLLDSVMDEVREAGGPAEIRSELEAAGEEGRLLLLLDGLDELGQEVRSRAKPWLQSLIERWPEARMVVASRRIPYEGLGDAFVDLEIQPLTPQARRELLGHYLKDGEGASQAASVDEKIALLERDPWLWDLSGNPLYLTFLALVVRDGQAPSTRRHELYHQVFDLLLRGQHRRPPRPIALPSVTREVLQILAHRMTETNETQITLGDLEKQLLGRELREQREQLQATSRYEAQILLFWDDVKDRTGILAPYAKPKWRFWHRTFREALTAERMAAEAGREGLDSLLERAGAIDDKEDQARWAEPFALLAGQVAERDALVTRLLEANRPLGLRALGSTQGLR